MAQADLLERMGAHLGSCISQPILKKTLAYVILLQFMINCFCLEKSKWIHLGMELFSFCNYVFNQRSFKTSHVERVAIICISIVAVLGSLQEAKDDAVF